MEYVLKSVWRTPQRSHVLFVVSECLELKVICPSAHRFIILFTPGHMVQKFKCYRQTQNDMPMLKVYIV